MPVHAHYAWSVFSSLDQRGIAAQRLSSTCKIEGSPRRCRAGQSHLPTSVTRPLEHQYSIGPLEISNNISRHSPLESNGQTDPFGRAAQRVTLGPTDAKTNRSCPSNIASLRFGGSVYSSAGLRSRAGEQGRVIVPDSIASSQELYMPTSTMLWSSQTGRAAIQAC